MSPPGGSASEPLVLIAENDAGVRELYRYVLAARGVRVECVADGPAALARAQRGGVALLVCDLEMPGLRGQELLAALQRGGEAPAALVVSGHLDPAVEDEVRLYPQLRGIWRKPFDVFAFANRVRELLRAPAAGEAAQ
jgi:two-component system response regulator FixJ